MQALLSYVQSGISETRRKVAKSVGDLEREQEANNKLLQVLESDLTNYSQRFAEAQRNKRLASLPVDVLKNAGATNIRYS